MSDHATIPDSTSGTDPLAAFATPEFRKNPYPCLRTLREETPVCRTAAGFYLVSRHADAEKLLRLSGDLVRSPDRSMLRAQYAVATVHPSMAMRLNHMLLKDPPEHTRLRRVIAQDFTPRRVKELSEEIARVCDRLLSAQEERLRDGEVVDLHQTFAKQLSLQVISGLIGVPEAYRKWLSEVVINFVGAFVGASEEMMTTADQHMADLQAYFLYLMEQRRREPQEDFVSALVRLSDQESESLDEAELMGMVLILWIAGFETTAAGIDLGVLAMFDHPDQRRWLRGSPTEAFAYVDEVLRYSGPAIFTPVPRLTTREVTLGGVTLPAGSDLRPVFAAANHDPRVFPDPERFDPARDTAAALAFSQGIHRCLGLHLARTEMSVALTEVERRLPTLALAAEPTWNTALPMHSPLALPVSLAGRV